MSGQIRVLRDSRLEAPGASYQAYLVESAVNRFFLKVDARDSSERQLAFQWSSPGGGLVASPHVIVQTEWDVKIPLKYDALASRMPGLYDGFANSAVGAADVAQEQILVLVLCKEPTCRFVLDLETLSGSPVRL